MLIVFIYIFRMMQSWNHPFWCTQFLMHGPNIQFLYFRWPILLVATNSILTQNLLIFLLRILYKVLKWLLPKVRVIDPDQRQNDADPIRSGAEILSLTMKISTNIQEEYELYCTYRLFFVAGTRNKNNFYNNIIIKSNILPISNLADCKIHCTLRWADFLKL